MTEQSPSPAPRVPDATPEDARPSANGRPAPPRTIDALEAELADWQRRAVMWRERALGIQELNEALTRNLEDLRAMLQLRAALEAGETPREAAVDRIPVEQWWTKVFRRETWTTRR